MFGGIPRNERFEPVLARISRPREEAVSARGPRFRDRKPPEVAELFARYVRNEILAIGTLDREHRPLFGNVLDLTLQIPLLAVLDPPRFHLLVVAGVRDEQELLFREPVDHGIVEDSSISVGDHRVLGSSYGKGFDVVGGESLQKCGGIRP